jgi:hypothetical protein
MTPISEIKMGREKILQPYKYVSNPSVMGSSNTNVPLYPSLVILFLSLDRQRGARGDFLRIILKSPLYPPEAVK